MLFECGKKVSGIFQSGVFDSKVIDNQDEGGPACSVLPESGCVIAFSVSMWCKSAERQKRMRY
jgi:hypothetical protein